MDRALPLLAALALTACGGDPSSGRDGSPADLMRSRGTPGATAAEGGLVLLDEPEDPDRPYYRDFGALRYGERRDWVVRLRNDDPRPVTIRSAQGACGCTRLDDLVARPADGGPVLAADRSGDGDLLVVPPGAEVELTIEVSTRQVAPNQHKLAMFRVATDSPATPFLTFEAHLIAEKTFSLSPAQANLGEVPRSYGGRARVRILTGVPGADVRVLGVAEQGERTTGTFEETFFAGEPVWHLDVALPELEPLGVVRDRIVLRTQGPDGGEGTLEVPVIGQVVPDVVVRPPLLALGGFDGAEGRTLDGELRALVPGMRVRLEGHRFEGDGAEHLRLETTPLAPDADGRASTWRLRLAAGAPVPPGVLAGTLVLETDDEQWPEVRVRYSGVAR